MKLTPAQQRVLNRTNVGKRVKFKYPELGEIWEGKITGEVGKTVDRYRDDGSVRYRFAYYVYSRKAKRVILAQRALFVSDEECREMLAKAKKEKWDIF